MIIKGIKYIRYAGTDKEWRIRNNNDDSGLQYVEFFNLNLLISKNGAGKSRTLYIINELAEFISGQRKIEQSSFSMQEFDFLFEHEGKELRYFLKIEDRKIIDEIYSIEDTELINRGEGILLNEGVNIFSRHGESDYTMVSTEINDKPIFPKIKRWSKALRAFLTSNIYPKGFYEKNFEEFKNKKIYTNEYDRYMDAIFEITQEKNGSEYIEELKDSVNMLGFNITDIILKKTKKGYDFRLQEDGRYYITNEQMSIRLYASLYMFSIILGARMQDESLCILIDDFGEGFDYENVNRLIEFIMKKSHRTSIQYFVTSNDQAVMNSIGLKYWSVIDKVDNESVFYNIYNAKQNFDDFRYTGLNNFDFFCSNFYKYGFGEDETDDADDFLEDYDSENLDYK